LPEMKKMRPGPSLISPPPLCQMPPWLSVRPVSSDQSVIALVETLTPATKPVVGRAVTM